MAANVFCDSDTCCNNKNGLCSLSSVFVKTESESDGYPSCQNYRCKEEAGND